VTLGELNQLDPAAAEAAFRRCCGSAAWARAMTQARPFAAVDAIAETGDAVWRALGPDDWLEAFRAHPRIGDRGAGPSWSAREQAGMQDADAAVRRRLVVGNEDYESRFGYIFIVCATGKTALEMLAALEARLPNDPAVELRIAAEEQRKITGLRLAKLMGEHS
jgi:OHCU decarboxylase